MTGLFASARWDRLAGTDFLAPEQILEIQDRLLASHIAYAAARSPFYRALFARHGIDPRQIRRAGDLKLLPCTEKADLTAHNMDFLASPPEDIVDVCLTSATTHDTPTSLLQTASDLERLAYNEDGAFGMLGLGPQDTMFICAALDRCFMAGLAYFLGGIKHGTRMVRAGSGSAAQHWHLIKITRATAIIGVPSLMRKIAEFALENGEDPAALGVRKLVAIGEPVHDGAGERLPISRLLEQMWGARLYATYASTEMATTICECAERRGGHLRPELAIVEILDNQGRPLPAGEPGEVVVTPLGVTGMPLLRFRTGDIACLLADPCPCGRRTARLGAILGRKNQMLKFKGTTIFPNTVLAALEGHPGVHGGYVEAHLNPEDGTDRIVVHVAVRDASLTVGRLADELRAHLRVAPEIVLIPEEELARRTNIPGKRKRTIFFDLRQDLYLNSRSEAASHEGRAGDKEFHDRSE